MGVWQLQEAEQRLSEVIRKAHVEGPQIITRHGQDVAVIMDIADYRQLKGEQPDFEEFLLNGPDLSEPDLTRSRDLPREIDSGDG